MMKSLIHELKNMGMINLKVSLEDEGVSLDYFRHHTRFSSLNSLPFAVKVGGCEAKTDINLALKEGAQKIVAPMIESRFAAEKFMNYVKDIPVQKFLLLESETAVHNAEDILFNTKDLDGVVVGRSDLCGSLGMTKKNVDDKDIVDRVESVFRVAKRAGLATIMGGSISLKSVEPIAYLKDKMLLDMFETRKAIFHVGDEMPNLELLISKALQFEAQFIKGYNDGLESAVQLNNERISTLSRRGNT